MLDRNDIEIIKMLLRGFFGLIREERRQKEALRTILKTLINRDLTFATDRTFGQELHLRAKRHPNKIFVDYKEERWTYAEMDEKAGILAFRLREILPDGGVVGIMARNCPEFLDVFFATQKAGLTCVPLNSELKSEGLKYILDNAGINALFIDADLYEQVRTIKNSINSLKLVISIERRGKAPSQTEPYEAFIAGSKGNLKESITPEKHIPNLILYTSGTTGHPKGVVYRYGGSQAKLMRFSAHMLITENDVYYTCLPLFHANALMITTLQSLYTGARIVLSDRFSASNFWNEVRASRATIFNTLGAMIPILMKQPPSPLDRIHKVKVVLSAACPKEYWGQFQERFKVRLLESYGAVDGGGFVTFNLGYGPPGSIGKPLPGVKYKLIDEQGNDAGTGVPGELIHYVGKKANMQVEYYRNPSATTEKYREGWVYSGDLMIRDEKGYLYFAGRKTDSIRRRGENISALEVESACLKHPDVLECAVIGVPSELGEEEVMLFIVPVENRKPDPAEIVKFLENHLPRYAIPRYIEIIDELPKTETHRVRKNILKEKGVGKNTWDREKAKI